MSAPGMPVSGLSRTSSHRLVDGVDGDGALLTGRSPAGSGTQLLRIASIPTATRSGAQPWVGLLLLLGALLWTEPRVLAADDDGFATAQPLLQAYCWQCHGEQRQKG